jgi:hypothetical protein
MERFYRMQKSWDEYRPSKAAAFWFAVLCVLATLIIGFGPGGWMSGGTAEQRVSDATAAARHELAAAICVDEFMAAKDAQVRLAKLKEASYWERSELVSKAGFATMPDRKEPNTIVASMCAAQLSEIGQQKS